MRFRVLVATALVGASVLVGSALATAATVPFKASYAGRVIVQANGDTATLSATGAGTGTIIKASKLVAKGIGINQQPCPMFSGTGTLTGVGGTIKFKVAPGGTACPGASESDPYTLKGTVTVTGGSGKFVKAKGTLVLGGTYSRSTGKYAATFKGKLSM
jgi:hypothetical protein